MGLAGQSMSLRSVPTQATWSNQITPVLLLVNPDVIAIAPVRTTVSNHDFNFL